MTEKYRPTRAIQAPPPPGPDTAQATPKTLRVLVAFLSTLVLVVSGMGYYTVGRIGNTVASGNLELGGGGGVKNNALDGATDILLVGSDSRTDAQGNPLTQEETDMLHAGDEEADNTDTMMVIRVPNDGSSATAISIPRDTYIHDPEIGNTKINGVYSAYKYQERAELVEQGLSNQQTLEERSKDAGRKALIRAISDLTGVTVDHYAEVGLLGFVLLTNAVNGVEVCLNDTVYDEYSGADFPAGTQTLDGAQGLAFVRQRHGLPRGDLDRIVRQQAYMASLVNKVLSSGTLTNPATLSQLGEAVTRSVVIDEGWDIMSFATQLQNLAGGRVSFNTIPVTSIDGVGDYGESIVTVDVQQVHDFFDQLLNQNQPETTTSAAPETTTVSSSAEIHVLNATYSSGLASQIAAALIEKGYTITETANATEGVYSSSQVLAADASNPDAIAIAAELGGLPIVENSTLDSNTVIVVAASDYTGPRSEETAPDTSNVVGSPGSDNGEAIVSPEINAGGTSPRCVN
ncbi:Transcriptional regulator lytR [Corynebacterium kutscheri]|uniref:Transcriptional attenuator, LytR family n=1 Tax=Corynebacterium kutscheri TaxID=35755 RepID=A0A0F6TCH3_9CORY|nr:LCP family protein [Corynebacterium kutscheri]AKE40694.1 transcriptional attenuator, LytR family [Corynebacterium kutscheri]VEH11091.1 Transcriptional regulator lytR [Corynebacterium kutscheri]VEH80431.1 Transcriptional regulator lytR [Corynebacterium kutscheri]